MHEGCLVGYSAAEPDGGLQLWKMRCAQHGSAILFAGSGSPCGVSRALCARSIDGDSRENRYVDLELHELERVTWLADATPSRPGP